MAFLRGYFDESGKFEQNRVVTFAGFVDADWERFELEWNALLRRNHIPALHVTKDRLKATKTRLQMYQGFIQIILRTVEHGFAMAVDVKAFNNMHRSVRSALGDDPHYMAVASVLMELITYASVLPNPTVAVICDEDENKACATYENYRKYRNRNARSRRVLKSIAFADDGYYPQLQAADLFSWVTRAEASHRFFGEDFPLRELYREFNLRIPERKIEYKSGFWGEAVIKKLAVPTAIQLAKLRR